MVVELVVTIKDDERTLKRDFLVYEDIMFVDHDPIIIRCVNETIDEFKGEPDDIKVRAMMVFK